MIPKKVTAIKWESRRRELGSNQTDKIQFFNYFKGPLAKLSSSYIKSRVLHTTRRILKHKSPHNGRINPRNFIRRNLRCRFNNKTSTIRESIAGPFVFNYLLRTFYSWKYYLAIWGTHKSFMLAVTCEYGLWFYDYFYGHNFADEPGRFYC